MKIVQLTKVIFSRLRHLELKGIKPGFHFRMPLFQQTVKAQIKNSQKHLYCSLGPNKKKISVFQVTGLKSRVGTHFFNLFRISPFKMRKIIFFPENLQKILGFTSKLRIGSGYPKHRYFFIWP